MTVKECFAPRTQPSVVRTSVTTPVANTVSTPISTLPEMVSGVETWPVRDESIVVREFELESGARIERVTVQYRLEGAINTARDNVVLVVHALTGTANAGEWWKGVIGDGCALDPNRHAILCANLLGGCAGTSGPRDDDAESFPSFTTRDQARLLERVLNAIGITSPLLICGGSLGGMVTLEFAATFPARVRQAVVLAAPAAQTAQGLAWHAIMRNAVELGRATSSGSQAGLALARMIGMLSYRTPDSLESRFGRTTDDQGRYAVNEWLRHHGDRLVERFDSRSYVALLDAMDAHDVGRSRGGLRLALGAVANRITGVGIPGDILFTARSVREWCNAVGATYRELPSAFGHDAFLLETERVGAILKTALHRASLVSGESVGSAPTVTHSATSVARPVAVTTGAPARPLRVALAGCGNVGSALLQLLNEQTPSSKHQAFVTGVLVRDGTRERPTLSTAIGGGRAGANALTTNPDALLDGDIDVLVEVIGGTSTAASLVEKALSRGIRVVTANKALLADQGCALRALANARNTSIDFEGAVAAAVPIVRCLRSGLAGVGVTRITGILNGTTNVVLERVSAGDTLATAVAHAQELGFAEADPSRDLSGKDPEDKLRILAWLGFGVDPSQVRVVTTGVTEATAAWAARVAAEGDAVKLLASCALVNGVFVARVAPTRVSGAHAWAAVRGAGNRIVVESDSAGTLEFQGPGAGGRETAGAVFGDIFHR